MHATLDDEKYDILMRKASNMQDVISFVVNELLCSIYFTFPFLVYGISQFERDNVSLINILYNLMILQSNILFPYNFKQSHPMYSIVQKAS